MSCIDGFVIPAKTAQKQRYIDFARRFDSVFLENGALRIVEGWGDDVPNGKLTDFRRAVAAEAAASIVSPWIECSDDGRTHALRWQAHDFGGLEAFAVPEKQHDPTEVGPTGARRCPEQLPSASP